MPSSAVKTREERLALFQRERPHLLSVAFRIIESDVDAEDLVQEAWIKYDHEDGSRIHNVPAWLTTVVSRLCIDALRRRRDSPQESDVFVDLQDDGTDDPEETALLANELTAAFVIILDELTPPQRVALVLHDSFGVSFNEIAHILNTTADSAKKLASRARQRLRHRETLSAEGGSDAIRVVDEFIKATRDGDTDSLVALLDPNVVRTADPQVLPRGGAQRIQGVQAVVTETRLFQRNAARAIPVLIDGRPGIVIPDGPEMLAALVVNVLKGRIVGFDVIADPQRLERLHISPILE